MTQAMQRLTQGVARLILAGFRPEHSNQGVATVETAGARSGEIGEEPQLPRPRENRPELGSVVVAQIGRSERSEADHPASSGKKRDRDAECNAGETSA